MTPRTPARRGRPPRRRDVRLRLAADARGGRGVADRRGLRHPRRGRRGRRRRGGAGRRRRRAPRGRAADGRRRPRRRRRRAARRSPTPGWTAPPPPTRWPAPPPTAVDTAVRDASTGMRPDVVVTLDGSDGHRDHVRVRDAVTASGPADRDAALPPVPAALAHARLGPTPRRATRARRRTSTLPEIGTPDDDLTTIVDTSDAPRPATRGDRRCTRRRRSPFDGLPDEVRSARCSAASTWSASIRRGPVGRSRRSCSACEFVASTSQRPLHALRG